ncbi:MAG: Re/Si-specific NAD(P)(+) transhydrogenase subunit alpha [Saprospiraceae bacterium]|nr:Re/Si-specific NAD(P)(+) transhydrogenase subunit alpha [Saprospiraceae bacterium]MDW8484821.1 Re/Si-specific NAD(P)(+) transhydrogenase subunit alpha [Saprospiraceae bacterium]
MQIGVPRETHFCETRAPIIPSDVGRLVKLGATVVVESGIGARLHLSDTDYEKAGAVVTSNRRELLSSSDIILRLRKPDLSEVTLLKPGCLHVSYLDPFHERALITALAEQGVSAVAMEFIPRTTRAQKMDALSSQASLAGYAAVILAAERTNRVFPMMTTPAGTINPARVFVIGAGVAGLQAIATAKRLGARVDAFDTRPVVAEQVRSLGARFVEVDLGETGQTKEGYAQALTEEQLRIQREAMARQCAISDIVITTAQVFGKKAPIIITREMIAGMRPGSIIVDLAIETGGNTEGAQLGQEVEINGVRIIALENMPGRVAAAASQMYSANLYNFVDEFWDRENKRIALNLEDDILQACLVTHDGKVRRDF